MSEHYAGLLKRAVFGDEYPIPDFVERWARSGAIRPALDSGAVCPYFYVGTDDDSVVLWVDAPDEAQRECGGARFRVDGFTADSDYLGELFGTEDEKELQAYMADHWEIR